ncbi:hypothetical protein BC835DRAFT_743935 [Cytidiella melzeri]|nr:hypothetical protein BC835DRAFT_743935 [Cytidiella melzeri]
MSTSGSDTVLKEVAARLGQGALESTESKLVAAVCEELAHLEQFGRPLLRFQLERKQVYGYKEQSSCDHIEHLECYAAIATSLVPKHSALHRFRVRHPDLQPSNATALRPPDQYSWKYQVCSTAHTPRYSPRSFARFTGSRPILALSEHDQNRDTR